MIQWIIYVYVLSVCVHAWEWIWSRALLETHLGMFRERAFQPVHVLMYVCLCVPFAFTCACGSCGNACLRGLCFSFDALVWSTWIYLTSDHAFVSRSSQPRCPHTCSVVAARKVGVWAAESRIFREAAGWGEREGTKQGSEAEKEEKKEEEDEL